MRKAVTVFFICLFSLAAVESASAQDHHSRFRGQRYEWRRHRHPRRVRVLGVRYFRQDNHGRRRRVIMHHRNAERRRWHRRAQRRMWIRRHHRAIQR